jgi:hypothetical protein
VGGGQALSAFESIPQNFYRRMGRQRVRGDQRGQHGEPVDWQPAARAGWKGHRVFCRVSGNVHSSSALVLFLRLSSYMLEIKSIRKLGRIEGTVGFGLDCRFRKHEAVWPARRGIMHKETEL